MLTLTTIISIQKLVKTRKNIIFWNFLPHKLCTTPIFINRVSTDFPKSFSMTFPWPFPWHPKKFHDTFQYLYFAANYHNFMQFTDSSSYSILYNTINMVTRLFWHPISFQRFDMSNLKILILKLPTKSEYLCFRG